MSTFRKGGAKSLLHFLNVDVEPKSCCIVILCLLYLCCKFKQKREKLAAIWWPIFSLNGLPKYISKGLKDGL